MKAPEPSQGIIKDFERAFRVYISAAKKLQKSGVLAEMFKPLPFSSDWPDLASNNNGGALDHLTNFH